MNDTQTNPQPCCRQNTPDSGVKDLLTTRQESALKDFDAIIIGSGIGGLTCGAFLARAGKKVLVLEKHSKIGGYAHHFKRKRFLFESGIHSAPLCPGGTIRSMLELLGVNDRIETVMLPEMYHIQTPDYQFTMHSQKEDIRNYIAQRFPSQSTSFSAFEKYLDQFRDHIVTPIKNIEKEPYVEDAAFVSQFHNLSYKDFIARHFSDPALCAGFHSQWPYGGISSQEGAALFHTVLFLMHFDEGSYSIRGGFSTLADALAYAITSRGGRIQTTSEVTRIRTEGEKVTAVGIATGEEFSADHFVSNISPYQVYHSLLDETARNRRWVRRLSNLNPSVSSMIVYLGMKPGSLDQLQHYTHFWSATSDNAPLYRAILANDKNVIDHLVILKNTHVPQSPTLTLMNFVQKSYSSDWKSDKMKLADKMVATLERLFPGIKDAIELMEVGSPETFERYTGNTLGAIYGFENVKSLYGEAKIPIATHLKNFYQTGHWGRPGCGIWNVMINGHAASQQILRQSNP